MRYGTSRTISMSNVSGISYNRIYYRMCDQDDVQCHFFVSTKRQFPSIRARIPRQILGVARRDAARKFGFESERGRGVLAALAVAYKL